MKENSILSKEINLGILRSTGAERIAAALLALWCLLPLAMAGYCLAVGVGDQYVQGGTYIPYGPCYYATLTLYRRAFLVLGTATMLFAATQIPACRHALASRETLKRQPWLYLLLGLLAWSAISTALSDDPLLQFRGSQYRCDGFYSYLIYASICVCALRIRQDARKKRLFTLFISVVNLLCIIMLLEALKVEPVRLVFQAPFAAVFNQFNHFGYVLCMASLLSAGLYLEEQSARLRVALILSFALQIATLLVNDTFGAYLAVIVGLVAIVAFRALGGRGADVRTLVPIAVFIALSIVSYTGAFTWIRGNDVAGNFTRLASDMAAIGGGSADAIKAGTGRMRLWMEALSMVPDRPLFGYGPEGLMGDYAAKVGVDRPHNEFIQYMIFLGIPALVLYLSALGTLLVSQLRRLHQGALPPMVLVAAGAVVGYAASSFVGNTMFNTAPYFWMLLGFAAWIPDSEGALFASSGGNGATPTLSGLPRLARVTLVALGSGLAALAITFAFVL